MDGTPETIETPTTADELTSLRCVGCEGIGTHMTEEDAARQAALVPAWKRSGTDAISREFSFGDFAAALAFTNEVGRIAEDQWHHPDIELGWGRCRVTLTTHAVGGLTINDFILAAHLDRLPT